MISCVNPLAFDMRGAHGRVINNGEGSAAESAAELQPEATVVGAFHNVSAVGLWGEDEFLDEDVIVVGDSVEGKQVAIDMAGAVTGRPGVDGGKLRLARVLEPFTAVLISINRKYKTHSGPPSHGTRGALRLRRAWPSARVVSRRRHPAAVAARGQRPRQAGSERHGRGRRPRPAAARGTRRRRPRRRDRACAGRLR